MTDSTLTKRSWPILLAVLATLAGGFVLAPAAIVAAAGSVENGFRAIQDGGWAPFLVGVAITLVLAVLVPLAATRVPTALLIALTLLPWFVGCITALLASLELADVAALDPSRRATMLALGITQYMQGHLTGALTSGGIGAGVLAGLSWGTHTYAGERQAAQGAGLGLALAFALALIAALCTGVALGLSLGVGALAFTLAAVVAGAGPMLIGSVGASLSSTRAQELGAATALFATLLLACACTANSTLMSAAGLSAIAGADPASRTALLTSMHHESTTTFALGLVAFALALSVPAAAAYRAHRSTKLTRGSYIGGSISLAVLLAMLAFHIATSFAAQAMNPSDTRSEWPVQALLTP